MFQNLSKHKAVSDTINFGCQPL